MKTRGWTEVRAALTYMVSTATALREKLQRKELVR